MVEFGARSTIYKSGSLLCSRKGDLVRKKTFFQSRSSFPTARPKRSSICSSLWTSLGMARRDLKLAALKRFLMVCYWPGKLTTAFKLAALWQEFLSTSVTNLASCAVVEIFHLPLPAFGPKNSRTSIIFHPPQGCHFWNVETPSSFGCRKTNLNDSPYYTFFLSFFDHFVVPCQTAKVSGKNDTLMFLEES